MGQLHNLQCLVKDDKVGLLVQKARKQLFPFFWSLSTSHSFSFLFSMMLPWHKGTPWTYAELQQHRAPPTQHIGFTITFTCLHTCMQPYRKGIGSQKGTAVAGQRQRKGQPRTCLRGSDMARRGRLQVPITYSVVPLDCPYKTQFKDKILRISQRWPQNIKSPSREPFWAESGARTLGMPTKPVWVQDKLCSFLMAPICWRWALQFRNEVVMWQWST